MLPYSRCPCATSFKILVAVKTLMEIKGSEKFYCIAAKSLVDSKLFILLTEKLVEEKCNMRKSTGILSPISTDINKKELK